MMLTRGTYGAIDEYGIFLQTEPLMNMAFFYKHDAPNGAKCISIDYDR
ncbi:MAG: hypothetical protein ABIN94_14950 [Ferruginibacter sp.]